MAVFSAAAFRLQFFLGLRAGGVTCLSVSRAQMSMACSVLRPSSMSLALETAAAVQPFIQSGRLKALGAGTTKRLSTMPYVPTIAEQGFKDFSAVTWLMLLYPASTDKPLVAGTLAAINKAMQTAEVDARMRQIGAIPRFSTSPAEATAFVRSEYAHWGEAVGRSGVRLD